MKFKDPKISQLDPYSTPTQRRLSKEEYESALLSCDFKVTPLNTLNNPELNTH